VEGADEQRLVVLGEGVSEQHCGGKVGKVGSSVGVLITTVGW
jgi:hypothetical protein